MPRRDASRRPGFTLTELMVTVALIAVLLAFLLPTLAGVSGSGRMAKGASNMRWIGALERADPGYFAANNFFDNDRRSGTRNRSGPFTNAQIRIPDRSLYLVDSFAGEIINRGHFCDVEEHT